MKLSHGFSKLRWVCSFSLNKSSPKWTVKKDLLLQSQHLSERFLPRETLDTHSSSPLLHLYLLLYIFIALCLCSSLALWGYLANSDSDRTNDFVFVFSFFIVPHESSCPPRPCSCISLSPVAHKLVSFSPSRTSCQSRWALPPSQSSALWLLLWKTLQIACGLHVKRINVRSQLRTLSSCAWVCGC